MNGDMIFFRRVLRNKITTAEMWHIDANTTIVIDMLTEVTNNRLELSSPSVVLELFIVPGFLMSTGL